MSKLIHNACECSDCQVSSVGYVWVAGTRKDRDGSVVSEEVPHKDSSDPVKAPSGILDRILNPSTGSPRN